MSHNIKYKYPMIITKLQMKTHTNYFRNFDTKNNSWMHQNHFESTKDFDKYIKYLVY